MTVRKAYAGYRPTNGPARIVVRSLNMFGKVLHDRPLRHLARHSPTGMEWGYAGSGPADLARSILVDALGPRAHCGTCNGHRSVVYDDDLRDFRAPNDEGDGLAPEQPCYECSDGYRQLPYQKLKHEIVSRLPKDGFTLTEAEVLEWYDRQEAQTSE